MSYNVQTPLQSAATSLQELEQWVRDDLACLCYPPANWVVPTAADGGGGRFTMSSSSVAACAVWSPVSR